VPALIFADGHAAGIMIVIAGSFQELRALELPVLVGYAIPFFL